MNYTKEMHEANIPPEMGMKFICNNNMESSRNKDFNGKEVEVIGICDCGGRVAITFEHKSLGIGCGVFTPDWVKPIDTRTDTEKAVDDLIVEDIVGLFSRHLRLGAIQAIKAGKITGVKWVGND